MKRKIVYVLGTVLVGALTVAAVANGPYYALPAWAQKLACATTSNCPRFIELADWNSAAVLDRETGLVWEKSPDGGTRNWFSALRFCMLRQVGGRMGWRLPNHQEFTGLVEARQFVQGDFVLASGHPFTNISTANNYWSATSEATAEGPSNVFAYAVRFEITSPGGSFSLISSGKSAGQNLAWCVRGGQGMDAQ